MACRATAPNYPDPRQPKAGSGGSTVNIAISDGSTSCFWRIHQLFLTGPLSAAVCCTPLVFPIVAAFEARAGRSWRIHQLFLTVLAISDGPLSTAGHVWRVHQLFLTVLAIFDGSIGHF